MSSSLFTIHSSASSSSSNPMLPPSSTTATLNNSSSSSSNSTEYAPRHAWGIGTLSRYQAIEQIGEGTYGQVYRARDTFTGAEVALKKMIKHHESEGFPKTETREIKILNSLRHPNMVLLKQLVTSMDIDESNLVGQSQAVITQSGPSQSALLAAAAAAMGTSKNVTGTSSHKPPTTTTAHNDHDPPTATTDHSSQPLTMANPNNAPATNPTVVDKTGDIFMVFEYVDYDLTGLLDSEYKFEPKQIKVIVWQLLNVLDFLHNRNYVHRDLKCSNILLMDDHTVKLADFGLSRSLPNDSFEKIDMTYRVITLWYRPPELLLGSTRYDSAIDLWSVGCIIMELFIGKPVLKANVESEQIVNIMNILGAPPVDSTLRKCPGWSNFVQATGGTVEERKSRLTEWIQRYPNIAVDTDLVSLLTRLFEGDPRRRISAREALSSRYFRDIDSRKPLASLKGMLVKQNTSFRTGVDLHEFQAKKRRKDKIVGDQAMVTGTVPPVETSNTTVPLLTTIVPSASSSNHQHPPTASSSVHPNPPMHNNAISNVRNNPHSTSSHTVSTPGSSGSTSLLGSGPSTQRTSNTPSSLATETSTNNTLGPSQTLLASKFLSSLQEIFRTPIETIESRLRQLTNEFLQYFTPSWQPVVNRVTDPVSFAKCTPQDITSIVTALQIIKQDIDTYMNEVYVILQQHPNMDVRSRSITYVDACNSTLSRMVYDINRSLGTLSSFSSVPNTTGTASSNAGTTNWPNASSAINNYGSTTSNHRTQSSTVNVVSRNNDQPSSSSSSSRPSSKSFQPGNDYHHPPHPSSSSSSFHSHGNNSTSLPHPSSSSSSTVHHDHNPKSQQYRNNDRNDRSYQHHSSSRRSDGHDNKRSRH